MLWNQGFLVLIIVFLEGSLTQPTPSQDCAAATITRTEAAVKKMSFIVNNVGKTVDTISLLSGEGLRDIWVRL